MKNTMFVCEVNGDPYMHVLCRQSDWDLHARPWLETFRPFVYKWGLEWFKMAYYIVITFSFCHYQNLKLTVKLHRKNNINKNAWIGITHADSWLFFYWCHFSYLKWFVPIFQAELASIDAWLVFMPLGHWRVLLINVLQKCPLGFCQWIFCERISKHASHFHYCSL